MKSQNANLLSTDTDLALDIAIDGAINAIMLVNNEWAILDVMDVNFDFNGFADMTIEARVMLAYAERWENLFEDNDATQPRLVKAEA